MIGRRNRQVLNWVEQETTTTATKTRSSAPNSMQYHDVSIWKYVLIYRVIHIQQQIVFGRGSSFLFLLPLPQGFYSPPGCCSSPSLSFTPPRWEDRWVGVVMGMADQNKETLQSRRNKPNRERRRKKTEESALLSSTFSPCHGASNGQQETPTSSHSACVEMQPPVLNPGCPPWALDLSI